MDGEEHCQNRPKMALQASAVTSFHSEAPLVDQSFTHTDARRLSDCFPYLLKQKQNITFIPVRTVFYNRLWRDSTACHIQRHLGLVGWRERERWLANLYKRSSSSSIIVRYKKQTNKKSTRVNFNFSS